VAHHAEVGLVFDARALIDMVDADPALLTMIARFMRLANLRRANGFTQMALARAIGRPQSHIAQLETAHTRRLFHEAISIAAVLDVTSADTAHAGWPGDSRPRRNRRVGCVKDARTIAQ
jgi:DNA-binding XRE family transcriptional regulator